MIKRKCDCENQDCDSLEVAPVFCNLTRNEFFLNKLEFFFFLNMSLAAKAVSRIRNEMLI